MAEDKKWIGERHGQEVTTTSGRPPTQDGSAPEPIEPSTGQHGAYWVLSEVERAKGFVRPVRTTYVHIGPPGPKYSLRDLNEDETARYASKDGYVKFEAYPEDSEEAQGGNVTGCFWTQMRLDRIRKGCGVATTMGLALAETYARDPKFYGSTFCVRCRDHFPVNEFVWDGTDEPVGS